MVLDAGDYERKINKEHDKIKNFYDGSDLKFDQILYNKLY